MRRRTTPGPIPSNLQLQLQLSLPAGRGGKRAGAGRKPKGARREVPHLRRRPVEAGYPVHLTVELLAPRRTLRTRRILGALKQVLRELHAARGDFRVTSFALQRDHLHLIAEADGPSLFSSGVRALMIRLAVRINRATGRKGRLFRDRHHRRVLKTPGEVRATLAYVLCNRRRHLAQVGELPPEGSVDEYSSARWFGGWKEAVVLAGTDPPVAEPRTWLSRTGWKRHGLISIWEVPG